MLVFIVRVSTWVWAKIVGFTQNNDRKRQMCLKFLGARGTSLACLVHESVAKAMP